MAPSYKLTYGDVRGLGEPARLILHYAAVPFEDDRIDFAKDMDRIRPGLPFGQVPVLTIDGTTKIPQSQAIYRFLARRHGLAGKDDVEQALVDGYGDFLQDLNANYRAAFQVLAGRKEGNYEQLVKEAEPFLEKFNSYLDKILAASGNGFFLKSGPTWPDFVAANIFETATKLDMKPIKESKGLKKIHDSVKALPQLQAYLSKRADTKF